MRQHIRRPQIPEILLGLRLSCRMLGATPNPLFTRIDHVFREVAAELGRPDSFQATDVAVHFGEPGKTVKDPYFGGEGPDRTGCIYCGACMTGCRHGAKNTLDKNYLWLAEKRVTVLSTVPTLLAMLDEEVPTLRLLILGGEVNRVLEVRRIMRMQRFRSREDAEV